MGNAVVEIHRPVDGIDDPLAIAIGITAEAFLAVERVARPRAEQDAFDQRLGFPVERQLDVVVGRLVHGRIEAEVGFEQLARFLRGVDGEFEIGHARKVKSRTGRAKCQETACVLGTGL